VGVNILMTRVKEIRFDFSFPIEIDTDYYYIFLLVIKHPYLDTGASLDKAFEEIAED
jgi:hypothetical protein